jgi:hypothetical protein
MLEKGVSQKQVDGLIARALAIKDQMHDVLRAVAVSQMRDPKSSAPSGGRYFEVPVSRETFLCSGRRAECAVLGDHHNS